MTVARYTAAGALDATFGSARHDAGDHARLSVGSNAVGSDLALERRCRHGRRASAARTCQPEGIRDLPVVARLAEGRLVLGRHAPGARPRPRPGALVPGPAPAAPPVAREAAALPSFASLVTLPGTKACVSRRRFSIRLRVPRGSTVTSAEVKVNGKRVAVRRGARLRSVVNLTKLPKGRFRVQITMKLADGRTVKGTRAYRTCAVKRRSGAGPRV